MKNGSMYIDFSLINAPADPTGHIKRKHLAKAKTGTYCEKCPNALLCISGHVAVQQCTGCMRTFIDGSLIPGGVICEGFEKEPQVFVKSCAKCVTQHVRARLDQAMEPIRQQLVGAPLTPELLAQVRANVEAQAKRLLNDYGWEINVDVVCEDE